MRNKNLVKIAFAVGISLTALTGCGASPLPNLESSLTPVGTSDSAEFSGRTLTADDVSITIVGSEVTPPGEGANKNGEFAILTITYDTKNLTDQDTDAVTEWFTHFRAVQDIDDTTVSELGISTETDSGSHPVGLIPKGETVRNTISYQITYNTNPVKLIVTDSLMREIVYMELDTVATTP